MTTTRIIMGKIKCPVCLGRPRSTVTKYGTRNDCCNLWSWGNAPLVDALTHGARKKAHTAFDPLWKDRIFTRGEAYMLLSEYLSLSSKECHMKLMDFKTAMRVPIAVKFIRSLLE